MNNFLKIQTENNKLSIKIDIKQKIIKVPDDINSNELEMVKNQNVYIEGRGPVELYAFLSFYAVKFGCKSIHILEFNTNQYYCIYNDEDDFDEINPNKCWFSKEENIVQIKNSTSYDGRWLIEEIKSEVKCFRLKKENKPLIITGNGPVLFYAVLGASASVSCYDEVFINKPQEKKLISIIKGVDSVAKKEIRNGKVIGILGDPNCGKSVFAKILEKVLRLYFQDEKSVWCYDCDEAAKTQDWFIFGLQNAKNETEISVIKQLRNNLKKKWTLSLEEDVVNYLQNSKKSLDYIIADMPGGIHTENKHDRIPTLGTVNIFSQCDGFIILSRKNCSYMYDEWIKELEKYNLEKKVIAEIISDKYYSKVPFVEDISKDEKGILHFTIQGLDRNTNQVFIIEKIKEKLNILCKKIEDL